MVVVNVAIAVVMVAPMADQSSVVKVATVVATTVAAMVVVAVGTTRAVHRDAIAIALLPLLSTN